MIKTKELIPKYLAELEKFPINSVLDLGCGNGRLSLEFAKKGIKVTGIDKINKGISNENFKFIQEDIKNFKYDKKYDLIISSLILHFFKKEGAIKIIEEMKNNTEYEGFNFLICMSNEDDCSKVKPENFYPSLELLKQIYTGWKIIKFDKDFTEIEEHDNLEPHQHNLIFFIAKKNPLS